MQNKDLCAAAVQQEGCKFYATIRQREINVDWKADPDRVFL